VSARPVVGATSVRRVSFARLEHEIRRLPGVVAVDVRASAVSVLAEPACDAVALGATLEALLAARGLDQEIRILGGRVPSAVRPHRLSALTMGSVAGIGLLGVATAAALQGALPIPDLRFQQEHRLAPLAGAPAEPRGSGRTAGPRLRIVAGDQPEWAAAEPTLVIPSTTSVSSPSGATPRTSRTVREVLVAAAARVELPELVPTPTTVEPGTAGTDKPGTKPTKPPTTTPPTTVAFHPRPTTTTIPKGDGSGDDDEDEKDKNAKWKWGNRREDPGGPRMPRPPKAQGPKSS